MVHRVGKCRRLSPQRGLRRAGRNELQLRIVRRELPNDVGSAVSRVVVDDQNLEEPRRIAHAEQRFKARPDVVLLVSRGDDNGNGRSEPGIARIPGALSGNGEDDDQQTVEESKKKEK